MVSGDWEKSVDQAWSHALSEVLLGVVTGCVGGERGDREMMETLQLLADGIISSKGVFQARASTIRC